MREGRFALLIAFLACANNQGDIDDTKDEMERNQATPQQWEAWELLRQKVIAELYPPRPEPEPKPIETKKPTQGSLFDV